MTNADPGKPALAQDLAPAADASRRDVHPSGRVEAFSGFYREFVPTLVAFLVWQGARLPDATDIAQETMARAYQRWDNIDRPDAWARRVASREHARRFASIEEPTDEVREVNPLLSSTTDVTAFEDRHEVLCLLSLLPPRQRQVLAWTYDGYTPMEIADELRISTDAARSSLRKARRALADHLGRRQSKDD